jgi:hypothetical protein
VGGFVNVEHMPKCALAMPGWSCSFEINSLGEPCKLQWCICAPCVLAAPAIGALPAFCSIGALVAHGCKCTLVYVLPSAISTSLRLFCIHCIFSEYYYKFQAFGEISLSVSCCARHRWEISRAGHTLVCNFEHKNGFRFKHEQPALSELATHGSRDGFRLQSSLV